MPIKKRRAKARAFDEDHREQLLFGPESCLLAGVGYDAGQRAFFAALTDAEQAAVLADMEADWRIHGPELMRWWLAGRDAESFSSKPWIYPEAGGPGTLPWAAEQFGEPSCQ